jgi:hypothetical protein
VPVWQGVGAQLPPAVHETQAPDELHTMPLPQLVPGESGEPVSTQVGEPPPQLIMPLWHGLVGVHDAPCEQVTQAPLAQTMPEPHEVPSALLPVSVQTGEPVEHEMVASLHAVEPVQLEPCMQFTHEPPEQTMFAPQLVPLAMVPVATQFAVPVVQEMVPVWQRLPPGMQLAPELHALQTPELLQTMLVPQLVPAVTGVPVSVQVAPPPPQLSEPVWQGLAGVQDEPAEQATHAPL